MLMYGHLLECGLNRDLMHKSEIRAEDEQGHLATAIIISGATNLTRLNCAPTVAAFNLKYVFTS